MPGALNWVTGLMKTRVPPHESVIKCEEAPARRDGEQTRLQPLVELLNDIVTQRRLCFCFLPVAAGGSNSLSFYLTPRLMASELAHNYHFYTRLQQLSHSLRLLLIPNVRMEHIRQI